MAIRRINSTGRRKIAREHASVFVTDERDGALTFDATIRLDDYGLPEDAQVFLEAYRQTTFMRFPYGTVRAITPPPATERRLTEFSSRDGLLFRVKITASGERSGLLLAEADRIPLRGDQERPDNRIPLLPPLGQDLGHEVWRVDFSDQTGPLLLVNRQLGDWKAVAGSPMFRSLVYPAAMREVLWRVYKVEGTRAIDDLDDWRCRWLQFAAGLPGLRNPPLDSNEDTDWGDWIDEAVQSFTRHHDVLNLFSEVINAEGRS
jgi:hypothetical protein